jgi:hypothetical protein
MPLCNGVMEDVKALIEEMKKSGAEEAPIPATPLTVIKTGATFEMKKNYLPITRIGEYLVVQKGL